MNIAELLVIPASMYPDHHIVHADGRDVAYEDLQDRVGRIAGALAALGVQPGDRVAVMQTNTPDVVEALFAVASIGAVFVPLNYRARADELEHYLTVAEPRVVLTADRYLPLVLDVVAKGRLPIQVVTLERPTADLPHLPTLLVDAEPAYPEDVEDDALAVLMFTSGTTANAKAVMLAHADLSGFVFSSTEPADGSPRGSVLVAAPLYHIAGLTAILVATFAGRRIVLLSQFAADQWLQLAEAQRVTHAFLVPTMLKRVLDEPAFHRTDLSSLRVLSYGAAPMPLTVIRRAIETLPESVQFINAFGQTETTSTVMMLGPDDHVLRGSADEIELKLRRLSSIGRPLPDVEVQILDDHGRPLGPGHVGEIAIRTERMMRGYHGQEDATSATIQGGWLRTRDLGWMDDDGYVFLAGRKSDLIIRGGENIAPDEIELVLASHPDVDEVAVFGLPDEEWGERVAAAIVLHPGAQASADALIEHARTRLASFKKPEAVFFVESLPHNALGKVLRKELRAQFGQAADGSATPPGAAQRH